MNIDIVLKTRGEDWDYAWKLLPDYISRKLIKKCDNITTNFRDYSKEYGMNSIFYLSDSFSSLLFRVVLSKSRDIQGRPIIALEGFSSNDCNNFLKSVPTLINYLLNNDSIRDKIIEEKENIDIDYILENYNDNYNNSLEYLDSLVNNKDHEGIEELFYGDFKRIDKILDIDEDNIINPNKYYEVIKETFNEEELTKDLELNLNDDYKLTIYTYSDGNRYYKWSKDYLDGEIKKIDDELDKEGD